VTTARNSGAADAAVDEAAFPHRLRVEDVAAVDDDGRAVPNFLTQALQNQPLTVYGDGSQTRSLCYVDDLIEGIVRLLGTEYAEPVNLGTDDEITMLQLATRIRDLSGSSSEIVFKPLPEDDPRQRRPDLTRARKLLNWQPRTSLDAGLTKTIGYFRERLSPPGY